MKRRIIAVLAAAALTATLGVGASPASAVEPQPTGAAYVAIGDSVASGNGLLPYTDPTCLRSNKAYPSVLAGMLGVDVVSAACSGAGTGPVAAQAAALAAAGALGGATQLVTITVGVNDLPWILALGACSNLGSYNLCQQALGGLGQVGPGIAGGVATAIGVVRQNAPGAHIVVTGYPFLFGPFEGTCSVGAAGFVASGTPMKFEQPQAAMLDGAVSGLNYTVQQGIALYQQAFSAQFGGPDGNIEYVDVIDAFEGHGLCGEDRWISGLVNGKKTVDRGFHPNVAGQQAYARTIAAALMAP
jgi:lysophospholipase L1-like esterase